MNRSLLIDKNYMALSIVTWRKAAKLLVSGKVESVGMGESLKVKTSSGYFDVPSIIRLVVDVPWRAHNNRTRFSRRNVMIRDQFKCQYCFKSLKKDGGTIDHVVPRSMGGKTTFANCVACCKKCNGTKGNKTLEEAGFHLPNKPKTPGFMSQYKQILEQHSPKEWGFFIIGAQ